MIQDKISIILLSTFIYSIFSENTLNFPMAVDPSQVTVSGLSAGGFMAVQYHVAFSSEIKGAGVFAGGPYYCAQASLSNAFTQCMYGLMLDVNKLISLTKDFERKNSIDKLANLTDSKVFLYSGTADSVVYPAVMKALNTYYQSFVTSSNIKSDFTVRSEHCLPTVNYGNACTFKGVPYINKCNYDGAGQVLNWVYGDLKPKGSAVSSNIMAIDQSKYVPSGYSLSSLSLGPKAYVYVPTACKSGDQKCKLHIVFHGCVQTIADVGDKYYVDGGYNEWAETNNIVVLYPQVVKSSMFPSNPNGCWDWWGYVSYDYAFKNGPQMVFVRNMVKSLMN